MSSTSYTGTSSLSPVIPFPYRAVTGSQREQSLLEFEAAVGILERAMDFCAVALATGAASWLMALIAETSCPRPRLIGCGACLGVLMVLLLDKHGDYRPCLSLLAVRETERLLRVTALTFLLASPIACVQYLPAATLGLTIALAPVFLGLEKWQLRNMIRFIRRQRGITRKAVIVGTGTVGRRIFSALARSPKLGLDPVAFVEFCGPIGEPLIYESGYKRERQAKVLVGPVTPRMLRRVEASVLILADPEMTIDRSAAVISEAEEAGVSTYVIPDAFTHENGETEYLELDGVMLAYRPKCTERVLFEAIKRGTDVAVATVSLLLVIPVLVGAALAVKLSSPGPVIFRQRRVGREGREFGMYKFRTMHADSPKYANSPIYGNDPRVTRVGRFLRHTCIDELPQLLNVLRGEMSLVGPRPEMPFIVEQYEPAHRIRLAVKPGITGLWQLSADRKAPIHENISYDLYYIRHRSILMDAAILLHTLAFAFRGV
jgi:exopolysaccharide biosynthesis polyprenyl glycosylphosphotransferase